MENLIMDLQFYLLGVQMIVTLVKNTARETVIFWLLSSLVSIKKIVQRGYFSVIFQMEKMEIPVYTNHSIKKLIVSICFRAGEVDSLVLLIYREIFLLA